MQQLHVSTLLEILDEEMVVEVEVWRIEVSTLLEILEAAKFTTLRSANIGTVSTLLEILGLVCSVVVGF